MGQDNQRTPALIASITPYFLEKGDVWFQENMDKVISARASQQFFQDNTILLEPHLQFRVSDLLRMLDELGYEKVLEVRDMGEFSSRGGVVNVFPININAAIQIEFVGNTIEAITPLPIKVENAEQARKILQKLLKSHKIFSDLKGLKPGDYLVHLDHGVGRFGRMEEMQFGERKEMYYVLEYAAEDILFVPQHLERKLSRYVGFADPHISRLSSAVWQNTKRKMKEDVEKLARQLLEVYAKRTVAARPSYAPDPEIEEKLAHSFPYQETPDQKQAIEDIYEDLSQTEPMDRIVCGDVGFGKTEVALRAIVRAVVNGYQTALLAPTTILAYQHFQTFTERLKDTPLRIALLSRLQSLKEQKTILQELERGSIDIVIGTHRLLSADVKFKKLGLLVIDDEQRFGVKQKEKFREFRAELDVLSLSATPIPRTLYMAMSSLKKISVIQTPPEGRLPVKTRIFKWSDEIIKKAITEEIHRGGQIYYLHNRVGTIERVKTYLQKLVSKATFGVAHGQMNETQLIKRIESFRKKDFNVLLATTIIENGIDLANVSTIIVDDATRLGLAQTYQLKGRVGRSSTQSFAYFLYDGHLSEKATLRLQALKEAEELGSGYRIAMRDLEIRGAGNILGKEQAGSVNAVGLNLYCQMLSEAVEKMRRTSTQDTNKNLSAGQMKLI